MADNVETSSKWDGFVSGAGDLLSLFGKGAEVYNSATKKEETVPSQPEIITEKTDNSDTIISVAIVVVVGLLGIVLVKKML